MRTRIARLAAKVSSCTLGIAFLFLIITARESTVSAQNVIVWGSPSAAVQDVPATATNVVALAAGRENCVGLRTDGTLVTWGSSPPAIPATAVDVVSVAAGEAHFLALRADGGVVAWGANDFGQADVPPTATNVIAIAAANQHSVALRADGQAIAWGNNNYGQTNIPAGLSNIVAIAAGNESTMVQRADGSVMLWGWYISPLAPMRVFRSVKDLLDIGIDGSQQFGLLPGGKIISSRYYQLSGPPYTKIRVPGSATNVVEMASSTNCTVALRQNGEVLVWGLTSVTNVPDSATNLMAVAVTGSYALGAKADGFAPRIRGPIAFRSEIGAGSPLPLFVRAVGGQPLHFQWLADGVPIPDSDTPFPQIPALLGTDDVAY